MAVRPLLAEYDQSCDKPSHGACVVLPVRRRAGHRMPLRRSLCDRRGVADRRIAFNRSHPANGSRSASKPSGSGVPTMELQRWSTAAHRAPAPAARVRSANSDQSTRPLRATTSTSTSLIKVRAPSSPPLMQRCSNVSAGSRVVTSDVRVEADRLGAAEQRCHSPGQLPSSRSNRDQIPMEVDHCVLVRERNLRHAVNEETLPNSSRARRSLHPATPR